MKNASLANLAAIFVLAGFFCWSGTPNAKALSPTNASADFVLGQQDFTHNDENQGGTNPNANTMSWPNGTWTDGKKFIVADLQNNRVLIYNSIPTSSNAAADVVIGQPDMTSGGENQNGSPGANTLFSPYTVSSDGIRLFVADAGNNRILIYNSIPTANNAPADVVVGQSDFTHNEDNQGDSLGANTLLFPYAVHTDGTKLFIADGRNNRILIYNTIPASNNVAADVVVGQPDFIHNEDNQGGSVGANTLYTPSGVYTFNGKMYVADAFNNRVVIYNSIPTSNNSSANIAVGQADLNSRLENEESSLAANTLYTPYHAFTDGVRLFVSDYGNSRVLIYNSLPTANNRNADIVIGQPDMASNSANQGGNIGANTMTEQGSLFYAAGKLFVGDVTNNRVLVYLLDAPNILNNNKSLRLSSDTMEKVKRKKTKLTFSGKKIGLGKSGRVKIFQNGVLKAASKVKRNGKWSRIIGEKQTGMNRLYQIRYYNSANILSGVSDQYNIYISTALKKKTVKPSSISAPTRNLSGKNGINPVFWGLRPIN